jgi:hypothetical protein
LLAACRNAGQLAKLRAGWQSPRRISSGDVVEFDSVEMRQGLALRVVADDQRNSAAEFAGLIAVEKVRQAVQVLRDENGHARGQTANFRQTAPKIHVCPRLAQNG